MEEQYEPIEEAKEEKKEPRKFIYEVPEDLEQKVLDLAKEKGFTHKDGEPNIAQVHRHILREFFKESGSDESESEA